MTLSTFAGVIDLLKKQEIGPSSAEGDTCKLGRYAGSLIRGSPPSAGRRLPACTAFLKSFYAYFANSAVAWVISAASAFRAAETRAISLVASVQFFASIASLTPGMVFTP